MINDSDGKLKNISNDSYFAPAFVPQSAIKNMYFGLGSVLKYFPVKKIQFMFYKLSVLIFMIKSDISGHMTIRKVATHHVAFNVLLAHTDSILTATM